MVEPAILLETDPVLARWSWCSGVYQQYHSMLFPLTQVYTEPTVPQWERIIAAANHVFGPSSSPPPRRCGCIIQAVRDNMSSFLQSLSLPSPSPAEERDDDMMQEVNSGSASPYGAAMDDGSYPAFDDIGDVGLEGYPMGGGFGGTQLGEEVWFQWPPPMNS